MPSIVRGFFYSLLFILLTLPLSAAGKERPPKTGILLVAFGTTVPEAQVSMERIEALTRSRFPDIDIRWAYTSKIVREKLAQQGKQIDSPALALSKMMDDGFTRVAVQSLHTIPGEEFQSLRKTVQQFADIPKGIARMELGEPLLSTTADLTSACEALLASIPKERRASEAVLFMGHGTHHPANVYYPAMQYFLAKRDPLVFLGTVESSPSLSDVIELMKQHKVKTTYLMPFMSVAGDHAHNDMAGDGEDSWKSKLSAQGITCIPILHGTGEHDAFINIWLDHLAEALARLT